MRYVALGDATSVDDYTGTEGGGAASQFARLIGADEFVNRAYDGCTTAEVVQEIENLEFKPDIVTLCAGGNDFLYGCYSLARHREPVRNPMDRLCRPALANLHSIAVRLAAMDCVVILSTIYDPTDSADGASDILGVSESMRPAYDRLNEGIAEVAREHGFLLADLRELFCGHGTRSSDTWLVADIEPSYAGATQIAQCWHSLYRQYLAGSVLPCY